MGTHDNEDQGPEVHTPLVAGRNPCCHWCRRYIKQLEGIKKDLELKVAELKGALDNERAR